MQEVSNMNWYQFLWFKHFVGVATIYSHFFLDEGWGGVIHEKYRKLHQEVLDCMINNILDQNVADSIAELFSLFNLSSDARNESRIEKLSKLHDIYRTPFIHTMKETW